MTCLSSVVMAILLSSKHVAPLDKPGKRYRGVHADVFVIADEDDDNGECM